MMPVEKKLCIKKLEGEPMEGELACVTSSTPRERNPAVGTLEDPDEGRLVHIQACNSCIFPMSRREKCDSELCFKC